MVQGVGELVNSALKMDSVLRFLWKSGIPVIASVSNLGPVTAAVSAAVKLAAFKIRTLRYIQVLFRVFST